MNSHTLQLATEPFAAIQAGRKSIESRLYDAKRQQIALGDQLVFVNRENPDQTITAVVIGLLRYDSFADLFAHIDVRKVDQPSPTAALAQVRQFYSPQDEATHGVLGIEFKIVA